MSGGSFNYLYRADSEEEASAANWEGLFEMAGLLETVAFDHPVTKYTRALADKRDTPIPDEVAMVWKAAEWYVSCDTDLGSLLDALGTTSEARIGND